MLKGNGIHLSDKFCIEKLPSWQQYLLSCYVQMTRHWRQIIQISLQIQTALSPLIYNDICMTCLQCLVIYTQQERRYCCKDGNISIQILSERCSNRLKYETPFSMNNRERGTHAQDTHLVHGIPVPYTLCMGSPFPRVLRIYLRSLATFEIKC